MTETLTLSTGIHNVDEGLELAYAANAAHTEGGEHSPIYENFCQRAGEIIGREAGVTYEEFRIFHALPPFAELDFEEQAPIVEKVQETMKAKLGEGMLARYLLITVENSYPGLDPQAIKRAYLFGRGEKWYLTRDNIVKPGR